MCFVLVLVLNCIKIHSKTEQKRFPRDTWLAKSVELVTLDLGVGNSSPRLGVDYFKRERERERLLDFPYAS